MQVGQGTAYNFRAEMRSKLPFIAQQSPQLCGKSKSIYQVVLSLEGSMILQQ